MWLVKRERVPAQQRDPRAATVQQITEFNSRFYPTFQESYLESLYSNVYLYACARARAEDLASLPVRVGADPDKPQDYSRNHPLTKLLGAGPGGPTMNISARRLIGWSLMQFDIMGRWGWEIASPANGRNDGVPFELWPIPASRITPVETRGGANWWTHYDVWTQGGTRKLGLTEMVYTWRPSQDDFRKPESLIRAANLNVSIASMQDRYDYSFLVNDARPAFVVVHEAFQRKSERRSFRRQFLDRHQGPDNAGKVAFVEASLDGAVPKESLFIHQLGLSQKDAEFIERYENQIRAICVALATPLSRLADSSRRTYANAERETKNYWRNAIKPAAVEMAEAFNIYLMPLLGDTSNVCWFDTSGVPELESPHRFQIGDIPGLLEHKVISVNEARHKLELPAIPGNDELGSDSPEATGEPLQLEDPERSANILASLSAAWMEQLAGMRDRQLQAVRSRAASKRGRQADSNGGTMASLYDLGFWVDQVEEHFRQFIHQLATAAYASHHSGLVPNSSAGIQWIQRWSSVLAARWVQVAMDDLDSYSIRNDDASFEIPDDLRQAVRSMWSLIQAGSIVPAEQVARVAARLAEDGGLDWASILATLD